MNITRRISRYVSPAEETSVPYWLIDPLTKGSYQVGKPELIGMPENDPMKVIFSLVIEGEKFNFEKTVLYKSNDPVKGELFQPVSIIEPVSITAEPHVSIVSAGKDLALNFGIKSFKDMQGVFNIQDSRSGASTIKLNTWPEVLKAGSNQQEILQVTKVTGPVNKQVIFKTNTNAYANGFKIISYDHIPSILVPTLSSFVVKPVDLKIGGKRIGYIAGAGDKVPDALAQMGYEVTMLGKHDINLSNLRNFDAVVTGVRAYNIHEWLSDAYNALMSYVEGGGVLLVQYNTNNSIGPVKARISPYPFTISRNRITDEEAGVNFINSKDRNLTYPNTITKSDFDGWIQERSVYNAEAYGDQFRPILIFKDPGENEQEGSLIVANYGKGKFVYSALAFFRQLPAGVTGAYRLFANLLAK